MSEITPFSESRIACSPPPTPPLPFSSFSPSLLALSAVSAAGRADSSRRASKSSSVFRLTHAPAKRTSARCSRARAILSAKAVEGASMTHTRPLDPAFSTSANRSPNNSPSSLKPPSPLPAPPPPPLLSSSNVAMTPPSRCCLSNDKRSKNVNAPCSASPTLGGRVVATGGAVRESFAVCLLALPAPPLALAPSAPPSLTLSMRRFTSSDRPVPFGPLTRSTRQISESRTPLMSSFARR
mmetsp:Transcript_55049/g.109246  ORF Transcript_55049/g.109246 Transcript_55049/m.109246 type:complete len:239 (+) Transcript_55049:411-1127(+)